MFDFEKRLTDIGQQTILCIGDLMLDDFVYGDVSRISPEAPAPVIRVTPRGRHRRRRRQRGAQHRKPRREMPVRRRDRRRCRRHDPAARSSSRSEARDQVASGGRSLAPDDAEAPLRLRALSRRICCAPIGSWRKPVDARTEAALIKQALKLLPQRRRGGAVRLCQGRADAEAHPRGDRAREEARQAGHRRSQGQRFLDLSRRHRHHAEPQGTGRGDASAGRTPATRSRRRPRRWPARSAARRCW